ncbi:MAG: tRNA (N(6)-L-threonylcarbamoyladenosine(37)-C(2))-methylthiotransferase [Candidatus Micrarchaeia archaeon]
MEVKIKTYGCTLNQADSNLIESILSDSGYSVEQVQKIDHSNIEDESDNVYIINTCAVKKPTMQKILFELQELSEKGAKIIATGCLAAADMEIIKKYAPNVSIATIQNINKMPLAVEYASKGKTIDFSTYQRNDRLALFRPSNSVIAKIPISEGCLSNCSFCETKFARGPLNSFSEELILNAVRMSIEKGAKEIELTAQDTGAYGLDRKTDITKLLNKICEINGNFKVRVGMLNPKHLRLYIDDLIKIMKDRHIYKFIHIPVQSGSNEVLASMKRQHTIEDMYEAIHRLRNKIQNITIATDIIVGYPSETDDDFNKTIDFIRKTLPEVVNISKFGAMPHAEASKMPQLDRQIINKRSIELSRLVRSIHIALNNRFIGSKVEVLITETDGKSMSGRTENYKQVIIKGNDSTKLGETCTVEIEDATANALYGRVL